MSAMVIVMVLGLALIALVWLEMVIDLGVGT